jgi:hypothetical protein
MFIAMLPTQFYPLHSSIVSIVCLFVAPYWLLGYNTRKNSTGMEFLQCKSKATRNFKKKSIIYI